MSKTSARNPASGITVTNAFARRNVTFVIAIGGGWTRAVGQSCRARAVAAAGAAPDDHDHVQAPSESTTLSDTATVTSTSSDLVASNTPPPC